MRIVLAVIILLIFGVFAPTTSAQEVSPVSTPLAGDSMDTTLLESFVRYVPDSTREDFFFPIAGGSPSDTVVLYWPRTDGAAQIVVDSPVDIVVYYYDSVNFTNIMIVGKKFTIENVWWALFSYQEIPDTLMITTTVEIPPLPPFHDDWCISTDQTRRVCGNTEFVILSTPVTERIAFEFADFAPDIQIPQEVFLETWIEGELMLFYGPGFIPALPSHHAWWEIHPVG